MRPTPARTFGSHLRCHPAENRVVIPAVNMGIIFTGVLHGLCYTLLYIQNR